MWYIIHAVLCKIRCMFSAWFPTGTAGAGVWIRSVLHCPRLTIQDQQALGVWEECLSVWTLSTTQDGRSWMCDPSLFTHQWLDGTFVLVASNSMLFFFFFGIVLFVKLFSEDKTSVVGFYMTSQSSPDSSLGNQWNLGTCLDVVLSSQKSQSGSKALLTKWFHSESWLQEVNHTWHFKDLIWWTK